MLLPNRMMGLCGTPTSKRATRPPGRMTRAHSAKNISRSTRLRNANPQMIPSTDESGMGNRKMSACARGAELRPFANMPKERSIEMGVSPTRCRSMQRSPVPDARSRTREPDCRARSRTARRRHRVSRRNVITRFTRSYRGAIASNMERTMRAFS